MKNRSIYEIQIFKNIYEDNNIEKTSDNQLMVYFIGSPKYDKSSVLNNDLILPVYIHLSNRKKRISKFIEYNLNWLDLRYVKVSSLINFDGTIRNYTFSKKTSNKYKNLINFDVGTYELKDPINNFEYVDFSTVSNNLEVLKKISDYDSKILRNEKLFTFNLPNNKKLIIPGIEIVNYFYVNSQHKSLKKAILRENAIEKLVKELPLLEDENKIYLNLRKRAKLDDKQLIFYFACKEKYQELFNDIYTQFLTTNAIFAPIPTDKTIKLNVHYFERNNCIYVLKILGATHFKEELFQVKKKIEVTHPKKVNVEYDKARVKKTPQENANASKELKTNRSRTISTSIENVKVEDFNDFNLEEHEDFSFNLKMKEVKLDKTENRTKKPKFNENVPDKPLSSRDKGRNKGQSVGSEVLDDKKTSKKLDYNELIIELKKNKFDVEVYHGNFKEIAIYLLNTNFKDYKKFLNRINTYMDNKETYRSYILIQLKKDGQTMYLFDIEARGKYNEITGTYLVTQRNSILLIEKDLIIEEFYKKYIGKFIYKFSISGGKWIETIESFFNIERYFLLKHSSVEGLFKSIEDKFK